MRSLRQPLAPIAVSLTVALACVAPRPPSSETPRAEVVEVPQAETEPTAADPDPKCDRAMHEGCPTVSREEATLIEARIAAARQRVTESKYQDVGAVIEVARLQLWRDSIEADSDGDDDIERASRNAMRAVAVDPTRPDARLVLALALGRSLLQRKHADDALLTQLRLHLVRLQAEASVSASRSSQGGFVTAAARALLGCVALETGDTDRAKRELEAATRLDPRLVTAWMALGDVARATADFSAAATAYRRAAELSPKDESIQAALRAAERREPFRLVRVPQPAALAVLDAAPLAPKAAPPASCPPSVAAQPANATLCDGLDALQGAATEMEVKSAAEQVIKGYKAIEPLCATGHPACGTHVAPALLSAARGFAQAGLPAKAILAYRLVLAPAGDLPDVQQLASSATLEVADRYYALGILDRAASYYERYARLNPSADSIPGRRGLLLSAARGNEESIRGLSKTGLRSTSTTRRTLCHHFVPCAVRRLASEAGWP